MRISSKGQVTIPQAIRDQFGLLPHTDIIFEIQSNGDLTIRRNMDDRQRSTIVIKHLLTPSSTKMTTDEIMKLTRL